MKKKIKKTDSLVAAGAAAYIIGLLFRLFLFTVIGDNGIAYFSSMNEMFLLCTAFITGGIASSVTSQVKYRMKREQYKNAGRIMVCAVEITVLFGILVSLLVFFLHQFIADIVFLERFSSLCIAMIAPAIFLSVLTCLLRGYFQGVGAKIPAIHSMLIERVVSLLLGMLFAVLMFQYGKKVALLLQNDAYAAAYGALGAAAGMLAGSLLAFIHALFFYLLYKGNLKRQTFKESPKALESRSQTYSMLLGQTLSGGSYMMLYQITPIVDQRLFYYHTNLKNQEAAQAGAWGSYYGICLAVTGILAVLCGLMATGETRRITNAWNREEHRSAKELLAQLIHTCAVTAIPMAIFPAVLAAPMAALFSKGNREAVTGVLQWGSLIVFFAVFAYLFMGILRSLGKNLQVLLTMLAAFVLHLLLTSILLSQTPLGINAVALGNVFFYLMITAAGFFLTARIMKYTQEWIRTFVVTLICGSIAGLIIFLLGKVLLPLVGALLTLLVCVVIGIIVYIILLILLRGVREAELVKMPGGVWIIRIAKSIRLM